MYEIIGNLNCGYSIIPIIDVHFLRCHNGAYVLKIKVFLSFGDNILILLIKYCDASKQYGKGEKLEIYLRQVCETGLAMKGNFLNWMMVTWGIHYQCLLLYIFEVFYFKKSCFNLPRDMYLWSVGFD